MTRVAIQKGFTLIEISIVLLIVAIILGYTVAMLPIQQELKQYREVDRQMDDIIQHLIAYAQVNGRLPCPDADSDAAAGQFAFDGREDPAGNGCTTYFGNLPNQTLGMYGRINSSGSLIDPWGQPFLYAVSNVDGTVAGIDLVTANGIRQEGMTNVTPNLFVCNGSGDTGDDVGCADSDGAYQAATEASGNQVAGNVAVVLISTGKQSEERSSVETENRDHFYDLGAAPPLNGTADRVYVSAPQSTVPATRFDDVVKWIPRELLFSKMIQADQLP